MSEDIRYNKTFDLVPGRATEVVPGVRAIVANNPSPFTFKGTVSYIVGCDKVAIIDNRAMAVACYDAGYTFVEKLQTVSTKFRRQQETGDSPIDFMRHYYDVYSLLQRPEVQAFIGAAEYQAHKTKRFRGGDNPNIAQNQAFILSDPKTRKLYAKAYADSTALYYGDKPTFEKLLEEIAYWADQL